MKDISSNFMAKIGFTKMMLLLSGLSVVVSMPVIYFASKEKPKVEENKVDIIGDIESSVLEEMQESEDSNSVMNEDFFGKQQSQEAVEFDPSPPENKNKQQTRWQEQQELSKEKDQPVFAAKNIFTTTKDLLPQEENPTITPIVAKPQSEVIVHAVKSPKNNKSAALELLADKDYPSSIASKAYDLSRIITTDSFIPAVMYTAVNSEIPSKTVLAIVESDVVGFHGTNILIPRGSKVEGVYEKIDNKHARRMQITWFKITRPDGIILKLDAESSDPQGASGLTGYLDQRLKDRYGGAILLSSINALAQLSVRENDVRHLAAVESFGREFGTLTAQIIRENMNAMPIIMIRQGTRFNIRPYQNIYFREPESATSNKSLFTNNN